MHEFALIETYFSPLAGEGALGLKDDAALITPCAGKQLVITQDAMTAGIHFFADDAPDLIARKLLRVNLSDLAAKGAQPLGYLLSLLLPAGTAESWVADFARGLAQDQNLLGLSLLGGDTARIDGPVTLSLTAIGTVETGRMILRRGAQAGDGIYVTGTLGDSALGLAVCKGELPENDFLRDRYLLPQPRLGALPACASAALDISDGLVQDAGHLAAASEVRLVIDYAKIPLSEAARAMLPRIQNAESRILAGGDDYELLFTAPEHEITGDYTRIGQVESGSGVAILDARGDEIYLERKGWSHF